MCLTVYLRYEESARSTDSTSPWPPAVRSLLGRLGKPTSPPQEALHTLTSPTDLSYPWKRPASPPVAVRFRSPEPETSPPGLGAEGRTLTSGPEVGGRVSARPTAAMSLLAAAASWLAVR